MCNETSSWVYKFSLHVQLGLSLYFCDAVCRKFVDIIHLVIFVLSDVFSQIYFLCGMQWRF